MKRYLFVAAVLWPLVLVSCRGNGSQPAPSASAQASITPVVSASAAASGPASAALSGCGQPHATGLTLDSIQSSGITRTYRLYLPKSYDPSKPSPLVLNFHGFTSNARQQETYSHMTAQAETSGFITVAADGTGSPQRWYIYGPSEAGYVDDFAFVNALMDHLEATLCIDPARVYSTGMSNGAGLSDELACELNDRIAAIAPVGGLAYVALRCDGKGPVPVIAFHGTADPLIPFDGGTGGRLNISLRSIPENAKQWAAHNGCKTGPTTETVAADVTKESYTDCASGADVVLYAVDGGGHTWPGATAPGGNGKTTHSIDATALMWDFFAAHPKPAR